MKRTLPGFTDVMSESADNNPELPISDPDSTYPDHERPSVVIVGRPNVGKSTLFNRILGNRRAIVGDEPGITRDRIQGDAEYRNKYFDLIDTGGILPNDAEMIPSEIFKQASVALDDADHIIFVIDARTDITGIDRELAQMLRRLGKPVALAVNKVDVPEREDLTGEFYSLGFDDLFPVSAEHSLGIDELLDHVTQEFPSGTPTENDEELSAKIKVAIIGRPNVGKSTLLNGLVGEERTIVSPVAGTTRDAVDETVVHEGVDYDFVDTAGIRRKGKTHLMAEKLSVVMARRHIRMANVVLLVLDATEGVLGLDATIAGYAHEGGRAMVICVNKWDAISVKDQKAFEETIRYGMKFLDYAPTAYISAKNGKGLNQLFKLIQTGFESATQRVSTGELNRFLAGLEFEKDLRVKYITQSSTRPPTFIVFTDGFKPMHFSTLRYLSNQIRKAFGYSGTPLVVRSKTKPRRKKK